MNSKKTSLTKNYLQIIENKKQLRKTLKESRKTVSGRIELDKKETSDKPDASSSLTSLNFVQV